VDITKSPGAHAKLKEYSTGRTILIRKMRCDSFEQPNATHWVQTANSARACPVFPGDTRITAVSVSDLLDEQKIAKAKMEVFLDQEAPHFLHTIMHMDLPPIIDRLRLPVVTTQSKMSVQEGNQSPLEQFVNEQCERTPDRHTLFAEFFEAFQIWLAKSEEHSDEKHVWSKIRVGRELPVRHQRIVGHAHERYVSNLTLKPAEGDAP
jgi:phage/plasmid-associated DNA primase